MARGQQKRSGVTGKRVDSGMVNLIEKLELYRREESKLACTGTFGEYLELVTANP